MDGYRSIGCVIGAVLINLTLGTFYSFGNVMPYLASYMRNHGNESVTIELGTWLTSAFLLGQGIAAVIGSYIERIYNSRIAVILGCIIHSTSTYMTIWAIKTNFTAVIIIYGFGSGFGSGNAYMASIIAAQKWFPSKKGLLTGIIVAGFGLGNLVFTNLQTLYVNPDNLRADSTGYFTEEVYDRVPHLFLYMGIIFSISQLIGCLIAFPPPPNHQLQSMSAEANSFGSRLQTDTQAGVSKTNVTMDEGLPDVKSTTSLLKHKIFYMIGLTMILVAPGVTFVNSLGKRYGQSYIKDDRYLTTVVSLASIANAGGRLTWGYVIDKLKFSICLIIKCSLFAILITFFPFGSILESKGMYLIWMFGLFFGISGSFVLFPVFVEQVFGPRYGGVAYGILFIAYAFSSICTSILMQNTVGSRLSDGSKTADEKLYTRLAPCAIIALSYCVAVIVFFLTVPVRRVENAIKRRKELDLIRQQKSLFNRADLYPMDRASLAEKTLNAARGGGASGGSKSDGTSDALRKENSLGSIVKYAPSAEAAKKIKHFF